MALTAASYQYLSQLGVQRLINTGDGPAGPNGVTSNWLVPAGGWSNGQRFPHEFQTDLEDQSFDKVTIEGVEYFLVPETSTNLPGRIAHYAQTTGVAELQNPPGGGVNRVRETLALSSDHTVAPEAVAKYIEDNDAYEEARKKSTLEDERLARQISVSPAREGSEGKLVQTDEGPKDAKSSGPSHKSGATKSSGDKAGS